MSRPRFLADHDINEHVVVGVCRREPALQFIRVRDIGMADRPDADILAYADQERLIVVSHDVNTMPAAAYVRMAEDKTIAGLLMVQQSDPINSIIDSL
ncbi:MAG: hypothetical protein GWN81_18995, partial [Phycisphaerae bacterium]|nr:hypothetical protein [Phycisphaerae bacterium]NIP54529.1 hypothetical protein [Phycisphaerae bacterium]NIU10882.1 hypothetical protein [Phycisphaerae bacterium]NIX00914.1 hypothetical protein [Phycisphaerae bacterium]NIX30557.1 hypothetical protein [Phycisphaerae bacterium]